MRVGIDWPSVMTPQMRDELEWPFTSAEDILSELITLNTLKHALI